MEWKEKVSYKEKEGIKAVLKLPTSFTKGRSDIKNPDTKPQENQLKPKEKKPEIKEKPKTIPQIVSKKEKTQEKGYWVIFLWNLVYSVDGKNQKIDLHQMKNGVFEFDKTSQEKSVIQTEKGVFVLENGKVFDVAEYHKSIIKEGLNGLNYPDTLLVQTHFEKLKHKDTVNFDDFLVQTKLIKSLIALGKYNVANEGVKGKILEFIVEQYNDVASIFDKRHSPYKFDGLKGKESYGEVRTKFVQMVEGVG